MAIVLPCKLLISCCPRCNEFYCYVFMYLKWQELCHFNHYSIMRRQSGGVASSNKNLPLKQVSIYLPNKDALYLSKLSMNGYWRTIYILYKYVMRKWVDTFSRSFLSKGIHCLHVFHRLWHNLILDLWIAWSHRKAIYLTYVRISRDFGREKYFICYY